MQKVLRSLIHEQFPLELRVKIDLLSRRRDIVNKEKQEELFKLLREYNVQGIVPLGPGTNRYAFKLNGFVVKVATDHDGKIDNLKEFKMAKRLYPHVTKTYEVSENGTLLVAEYIQPFSSFAEMLKYADEIRSILTELSSVYLIGDVGITAKNYANWGLRVGSDDPVCLDFAYVYDVSSDLFICRECKTNSMLVPNKDFTALLCPAPGCGKQYRFEDIRMKIGNDLHRHEIGDLSEEGYALTESHILTELTEDRSNYLVRKKPKESKPKKVEPENIVLDNFVLDHEPGYYINKEEYGMKDNPDTKVIPGGALEGRVIQGTAWRTPEAPSQPNATIMGQVATSEPNDGLAFSGAIKSTVIPGYIIEAGEQESEVIQMPGESDDSNDDGDAQAVIEDDVVTEPAEESPADADDSSSAPAPKKAPKRTFTNSFINNGKRCVSKLSNRIGDDLQQKCIFDDVKPYVRKKKEYAESFYKAVQNAIFRSLMIFCEFQEFDAPNSNNSGTHKDWSLPEQLTGTAYEPTLVFLERFWNAREVNSIENPEECIKRYRELFRDYQGIQREWIPVFVSRFSKKYPIEPIGAQKIADAIAEFWCVPPIEVSDIIDIIRAMTEAAEELHDSPDESELKRHLDQEVIKNVPPVGEMSEEDIRKMLAGVGGCGDEYCSHCGCPTGDPGPMGAPVDGVAFSGKINPDHDEEDLSDYEDYLSEHEDDAEIPVDRISVEIYPEEKFDVIKIRSSEAYGTIAIPLYVKLDKIDPDKYVPSMVDDRNGVWDWLIHMVPDIMFTTKDNVDFWLGLNDVEGGPTEDQVHFVILDHNEDTGEYIMGVYFLLGIYTQDENDENDFNATFDDDLLKRLNQVISENIGNTFVSHLRRSLSMDSLFHNEDYVRDCLDVDDGEYDHDEGGESDMPEMSDEQLNMAEDAAIAALVGGDQPEPDDGEDVVEVPVDPSQVENPDHVIFKPIHRPKPDQPGDTEENAEGSDESDGSDDQKDDEEPVDEDTPTETDDTEESGEES